MFDFEKHIKKFPQICFRKKWEIDNNVWYNLGQAAAIVSALRGLPLTPAVRQDMLQVAFVKGAAATTAIEGNTLSEEEVKLIQEGKSSNLPSRRYLEQEVKNVLAALNAIFDEVVNQRRSEPVSSDLIRSLHSYVGKELGESFEAVPGRFRDNEVIVGAYRPPDHRDVPDLVQKMCEWLRDEFGFSREHELKFADAVVEAIVSHVYLVWIHPFGDGNGRTARLLEFYLLLRGGLPDICSHILSNHYNNTRSEYYRQLANAGKTQKLDAFIAYAVQGLLDGLTEILHKAQNQQVKAAWINYVHETLNASNYRKPVRKRCIVLLSELDLSKQYSLAEMLAASPKIAGTYAEKASSKVLRDAAALCKEHLLVKGENGLYSLNASALLFSLPRSR